MPEENCAPKGDKVPVRTKDIIPETVTEKPEPPVVVTEPPRPPSTPVTSRRGRMITIPARYQ